MLWNWLQKLTEKKSKQNRSDANLKVGACPPVKSETILHWVCFLGCGSNSWWNEGGWFNCTNLNFKQHTHIKSLTLITWKLFYLNFKNSSLIFLHDSFQGQNIRPLNFDLAFQTIFQKFPNQFSFSKIALCYQITLIFWCPLHRSTFY